MYHDKTCRRQNVLATKRLGDNTYWRQHISATQCTRIKEKRNGILL
jgi:hypothetical protein